MPRAIQVLYSITKQVREYQPVRIEVTVGPNDAEQCTDEQLILHARDLAEAAMVDALARARAGTGAHR